MYEDEITVDGETRPVPYMPGTEPSLLEPQIVEILRTVYDPEIPVNVFELGLIYDLRIDEQGMVRIIMTLTTPSCPVAEELPAWIKRAVNSVEGVSAVEIALVWDPFWKPDYMAEEARLQLGLW